METPVTPYDVAVEGNYAYVVAGEATPMLLRAHPAGVRRERAVEPALGGYRRGLAPARVIFQAVAVADGYAYIADPDNDRPDGGLRGYRREMSFGPGSRWFQPYIARVPRYGHRGLWTDSAYVSTRGGSPRHRRQHAISMSVLEFYRDAERRNRGGTTGTIAYLADGDSGVGVRCEHALGAAKKWVCRHTRRRFWRGGGGRHRLRCRRSGRSPGFGLQ